MKKLKLVYGIGINDSETPISWYVNKKKIWCPYYARWVGVIKRCYGKKEVHKCYWDCSVHPDWLYFSNFRAWKVEQHWEGYHLDKDILIQGNRIYGPDTCAFVPYYLNGCLVIPMKKVFNVDLPLGVNYFKKPDYMVNELKKPYLVRCTRVDSSDKSKHVGYFSNPEDAHKAYQLAKYNQLNEYLNMYVEEDCFREDVFQAMRKRVDKLLEDSLNGVETKSI